MVRLKRILSTTWKYIYRNSALTLSTVITVCLTFFITTIFIGFILGALLFITALQQKVGLVLFFKPETEESYILNLKSSLEENPSLSIEYKSQSTVYKEYTKTFGSGTLHLKENEVPAVLRIAAKNVKDLEKTYNDIINNQDIMSHIRSYNYVTSATVFLEKTASGIIWGGGIISTLLLLTTFVIITIATNSAIQIHSEEIKTMQLIGEDRSSIRTPFVLVGTFCSIIGTTLSVLLIIVISLLTYRTLLDNGIIDLFNSLVFSGVTLPSIKWWHYTLAALSEILIGGIMGGISSFIAVKSRLKW